MITISNTQNLNSNKEIYNFKFLNMKHKVQIKQKNTYFTIPNKKTHNIQSKTHNLYTNSNLCFEINYNHNSIQQTHNCNFNPHAIQIYINIHSHTRTHI